MKVLVDAQSNRVQGTYNPPLAFSVSGKYVIDVPPTLGPVRADTANPTDIITAKTNALRTLHPALTGSAKADELVTVTGIDAALSTKMIIAPFKGSIILPGGKIVTQPISITTNPLTRLLVHFYGFQLNLNVLQQFNQPQPADLLYNFDPTIPGFVDFDPTSFTCDILDSTGSTVLVPGVLADQEVVYTHATPVSIRLRFTSVASAPWHLSDYYLLTG